MKISGKLSAFAESGCGLIVIGAILIAVQIGLILLVLIMTSPAADAAYVPGTFLPDGYPGGSEKSLKADIYAPKDAQSREIRIFRIRPTCLCYWPAPDKMCCHCASEALCQPGKTCYVVPQPERPGRLYTAFQPGYSRIIPDNPGIVPRET